jgi:hypothetical protein
MLHKKYRVLKSLNDPKFKVLRAQLVYYCMILCCCHILEILVKLLIQIDQLFKSLSE